MQYYGIELDWILSNKILLKEEKKNNGYFRTIPRWEQDFRLEAI